MLLSIIFHMENEAQEVRDCVCLSHCCSRTTYHLAQNRVTFQKIYSVLKSPVSALAAVNLEMQLKIASSVRIWSWEHVQSRL